MNVYVRDDIKLVGLFVRSLDNSIIYRFLSLVYVDKKGIILTGKYKGKNINDISKFMFTSVEQVFDFVLKDMLNSGYDVDMLKSNLNLKKEIYIRLSEVLGQMYYNLDSKRFFSWCSNLLFSIKKIDTELELLIDTSMVSSEFNDFCSVVCNEIKQRNFKLDFKGGSDSKKSLESVSSLKEDKFVSKPNVSENRVFITEEDVIKIENEVKKKFIGQEDVVSNVVNCIDSNRELQRAINDNTRISQLKTTALIQGATGTGKTAILTDLSKKFSLPFYKTSILNFTSQGYVGSSIQDVLVKLLENANGDIELAQNGIIGLDEFDKLIFQDNDVESQRGNFNKRIQEELLTFVQGDVYQIKYNDKVYNFDTSKLTIIFMGAFTNYRKTNFNIGEKRKMGFGSVWQEGNQISNNTRVFLDENDLRNAGIMDELVGRIKMIISTKTYTIEDLYKILIESTISPVKALKEDYKKLGYNVLITDDAIMAWAEMAYKKQTGARALESILSKITLYMKQQRREDGIVDFFIDRDVFNNIMNGSKGNVRYEV